MYCYLAIHPPHPPHPPFHHSTTMDRWTYVFSPPPPPLEPLEPLVPLLERKGSTPYPDGLQPPYGDRTPSSPSVLFVRLRLSCWAGGQQHGLQSSPFKHTARPLHPCLSRSWSRLFVRLYLPACPFTRLPACLSVCLYSMLPPSQPPLASNTFFSVNQACVS